MEIDGLIDVASRFYVQGHSQVQIARELGIDPSTVSRCLKKAREDGIVSIEIRAPVQVDAELGRQLAKRAGLSRAIVARGGDDLDALAAVGADYLSALLRERMRIGVGWGETLLAVVRRMKPGTVSGLSIAALAGGLTDSVPGIQGQDLMLRLAGLYPASRIRYLHAPSIVDSPSIRIALLKDRSVRAALAAAARSELALVGIGEMGEEATMFRSGHVGARDRASLIAAGAVGSMNSRFFDASGAPVNTLASRTVAIEWSELSRIPLLVAVARGARKVDAINGALRAGCINVLVTDAETATSLIERTG